MKLPATLVKSGLAVAGAGLYLFFRRLIKGIKKNKTAKNSVIKTNESQETGQSI